MCPYEESITQINFTNGMKILCDLSAAKTTPLTIYIICVQIHQRTCKDDCELMETFPSAVILPKRRIWSLERIPLDLLRFGPMTIVVLVPTFKRALCVCQYHQGSPFLFYIVSYNC
jgi:hypothetical protein